MNKNAEKLLAVVLCLCMLMTTVMPSFRVFAEENKKTFTFTLTGKDDAPMPLTGGETASVTDEGTAGSARSTGTSAVSTNDGGHAQLWLLLTILSVMFLSGVILISRRRNR